MGKECIDNRFTLCYDGNIGVAFSKYFVDENKYIFWEELLCSPSIILTK